MSFRYMAQEVGSIEKIKILIADDYPNFYDVLKEYLEESNFDVVGIATDGAETLKLIEEKKPDLVILDVVMPQLDGLGVLEKLKTMDINPVPRIIVFSTMGEDKVTQRAIDLGADYYVRKPFDMAVLVERIRQLFYYHKVQNERNTLKNRESVAVDLYGQIDNILLEIGIPTNIKGYKYVREAIYMYYLDVSEGTIPLITKDIYPEVARKFDSGVIGVKRAIEHAIELAWLRDEIGMCSLFSKAIKPKAGEFISVIANYVRRKNNGKWK